MYDLRFLTMVLFLGLALSSCGPALEPFRLPEDMAFKDLVSGQTYDTSSLRGKLLLINFWAAWSPASIKELPELAELAEDSDDAPGALLQGASSARAMCGVRRAWGVRRPATRASPCGRAPVPRTLASHKGWKRRATNQAEGVS